MGVIFSFYGLTPMRMTYEDICGGNLKHSTQSLAKAIGFDISQDVLETVTTKTAKQASSRQQEVIDRFRAEALDNDVFKSLTDNIQLSSKKN